MHTAAAYLRIILALALACLCAGASADTVIHMEETGGVYRLPCEVNGARMKMIFDTGASSVTLSLGMARYLLDNDYITADDFVDVGQSTTADGSVVDHAVVNLRTLKIGPRVLHNVQAVVLMSQDSPILLGQSAIQRLGEVSIRGNDLIIRDGKDSRTTRTSKSPSPKAPQSSRANNGVISRTIMGFTLGKTTPAEARQILAAKGATMTPTDEPGKYEVERSFRHSDMQWTGLSLAFKDGRLDCLTLKTNSIEASLDVPTAQTLLTRLSKKYDDSTEDSFDKEEDQGTHYSTAIWRDGVTMLTFILAQHPGYGLVLMVDYQDCLGH